MSKPRMYLLKKCFFCIFLSIFYLRTRTMARSMMKAAVIRSFGAPDVFDVIEVPVPKITKPNQVLVKVKAAGINPVDTYMRTGTYALKPQLPAILGVEVSGVIDDVDQSGSTFKKGDRVFCSLGTNLGGYAEYVLVNSTDCFMLNDRLSYSQGAAIYTSYFTAHRALITKGNTLKDDIVLIHGASGGVGSAAVQLAKTIGSYVVATVGSAAGEEVAKKSGADYVVYHNKDNYIEDALKHINKPGFDVIIEPLANVNLQKDMESLAEGGRIVVVGNRGYLSINARSLMTTEGKITAVNLFKSTPLEKKEASVFIMESFEHEFVKPIVGQEYGLREAFQAHTDLMSNKGAKGKLVFVL